MAGKRVRLCLVEGVDLRGWI